MPVRPSIEGSYERLMNETACRLSPSTCGTEGPTCAVRSPAPARTCIGVIYRPETERLSHYFTAELSRQFDAYVGSRDHAVSALDDAATEAEDKEAGHPFAREDR
jgi:erythromycin esterase-like protein